MDWDLTEALDYYRGQGAPADQNALKQLLREIQQHSGGQVPFAAIDQVCEVYGMKRSFIIALIHRTPSLRLSDHHCLELCAGPNCGRQAAMAAYAEKICREYGNGVELKFVPCMRMCGKGPNLKWDGTMYHKADAALLNRLFAELRKNI